MYAGNETTPRTCGWFTGAYQITGVTTAAGTTILDYPYAAVTNFLVCGGTNDANFRNRSYAHLSRRARRLAEDNDAWAAALGMTVDEYLAMIGRHPTLPRSPRQAYRTGLRLRSRRGPRMDHLVHRMRVRTPGRWLAGAGRRACGRRREPIDLAR